MILFSRKIYMSKDGSLSVAILGHLYQNNNNTWNHTPIEA